MKRNIIVECRIYASGTETIRNGLHRQSAINVWLVENPNSAAAVMKTLTAVIFPAPKRLVRRSLSRLEMMVPTAMIMEIPPA